MSVPEPVVTLVVAAGSGVRLGAGAPKPLRVVAGRTILRHALDRLYAGGTDHAVIAIPAQERIAFEQACAGLDPERFRFVEGGARRQDSVARGLAAVDADPALATTRIVLVHDAARPFTPAGVVAGVIGAVAAGAVAVVPVIPVVDSIRAVGDVGSRVVDRSTLRAVQTPQGFDRAVLTEAHRQVAADGIEVTDDAAACERIGHPVTLVPGSSRSMKITGPLDLAIAETLLDEELDSNGGRSALRSAR